MITIHLVLIVIAVVLFALAAFNVPSRVSLGWLGMAFFASSLLVR